MNAKVTILLLALFFIAIEAKPQGDILDSTYNKAQKYLTAGKYDSSILYFTRSHTLAREVHDTLKAGNCLIGIGISYDKSGRYEQALNYFFQAYNVYDSLKNMVKMGGTLKNIGNTYRVLNDFEKAEKFLFKALEIQMGLNDSTRIATVLNDIGNYYLDRKEYAKAYQKYREVITHYNKYAQAEVKAFAYNNIAITLTEFGKYEQASKYYDTSLNLMRAAGNQYGVALTLGNIASLLFKTKQYNSALKYQLENIEIGKKIGSLEILVFGYKNISEIYDSIGNFQLASAFKNEYIKIKDTIYKKEAARNYEEMEARYQNQVNQKEISILNQKNALANIQLSIQKRTQLFLFIVISLVMLLAGLIFRAFLTKKKNNAVLQTLNAKLDEANQSKAKLISIISHDLRSPISSLFHYLQLQKKKSQALKEDPVNMKVIQSADHLLEVMEDILIWSKSQMEHFKPSLEMARAGELFAEVVELNRRLAEIKGVTLETEMSRDIEFYTDINFIKIILRNLVSNAIKFTPTGGNVKLAAHQDQENIILSVSDTGPGFGENDIQKIFDWNSIKSESAGLGLKLVKEFSEKLNGSLQVSSIEPHGTMFSIIFPFETVGVWNGYVNVENLSPHFIHTQIKEK